jgi:outer membrane lipoprotein SlyB
MKVRFCTIAMLLAMAASPQIASAKGCLKGATVGGVGGHVAGGHGVLGAAAGCAVGRHMANKKAKQQAAPAQPAPAPAQ